MRAMILAAGRGERLRPLTDRIPKPLADIGGEPVIVRHIKNLKRCGFDEMVVNTSHLAAMIQKRLGDGREWGARIMYSHEPQALESAGGVRQALARGLLLPEEPFVLVNADIVCDIDFAAFAARLPNWARCHLALTENPPSNPGGDFSLQNGMLQPPTNNPLTYTGIGVYRPAMFMHLPPGEKSRLLPLLMQATKDSAASAEKHSGQWRDIGTPASLAAARENISAE